jgi:hypothetical protein
MKTKSLTAADLLNFLASAAEVLADDPEEAERHSLTGPPPYGGESDDARADRFAVVSARLAGLAERLNEISEEFSGEIEVALELARANGLLAECAPDCPCCGGFLEADPLDPGTRCCEACGSEAGE